jgi:hypothetical protein
MGRAQHKAEGRRTAEGWFRVAECGKVAQNPSTNFLSPLAEEIRLIIYWAFNGKFLLSSCKIALG